MKQSPKLVLFDCDGTLVDSQNIICTAMRKAYEKHELPCPPRELLLSIIGLSLTEAFRKLAGNDRHPLDSLVAEYKSAFLALRQSGEPIEPLYPGAREALETLAGLSDVTLGIVTGKSARGVEMVLRHHRLYDHFRTIQTADTSPSKPNPAMIAQAMRETEIGLDCTTVVGDTLHDIVMAQAAGVYAIGVAWGYHPSEELRDSGAAYVIHDFTALIPALKDIWTAQDMTDKPG